MFRNSGGLVHREQTKGCKIMVNIMFHIIGRSGSLLDFQVHSRIFGLSGTGHHDHDIIGYYQKIFALHLIMLADDWHWQWAECGRPG